MSSAALDLINAGWSIKRVDELMGVRYEFIKTTILPNGNDPTAEPTEKKEWFTVYRTSSNYCYVRFEPGRAVRDYELELISSFIKELSLQTTYSDL